MKKSKKKAVLLTAARYKAFFELYTEEYANKGFILIAIDALTGKIIKHNYVQFFTIRNKERQYSLADFDMTTSNPQSEYLKRNRDLYQERMEQRRLRKVDKASKLLACIYVSPSSNFVQQLNGRQSYTGGDEKIDPGSVYERTKGIGYIAREEGRFGSFPIHDEYGDDANAETNEWQDSYEIPRNTVD
jgi:hypothetical protein